MTRKGPGTRCSGIPRGLGQAQRQLFILTAGLRPKLLFGCMKQRRVFTVLQRKCQSYYCRKSPLARKPKEKSLRHLCCRQKIERNHVLKGPGCPLEPRDTLSREPQDLLSNAYNLMLSRPPQILLMCLDLLCQAQGPLATTAQGTTV